jgi:hypothetical protein
MPLAVLIIAMNSTTGPPPPAVLQEDHVHIGSPEEELVVSSTWVSIGHGGDD